MQVSASQSSYYASVLQEMTKTTSTAKTASTSKSSNLKKPEWNPYKVYKYLEDMNQGFQDYKKQAVSYYQARISEQGGDGVLTVDELKEQIKEWFPEYTLTDTKPKDVVQGKFYLYIDSKQLKKLAEDPAYRAKVYGLMDSELQGKKGYTLQYSDGKNVTAHLTGSIFSLAEENRKYAGADGIPYLGSCTSDHSFSSSNSHPQVRSMSFIYDNIDPAKSAAKDRKANAAKIEAEKRAEKKKAKKAQEEKLAEKRRIKKEQQEEWLEEIQEASRERREEASAASETQEQLYDTVQYMKAGSKYQSTDDIEMTGAGKTGETATVKNDTKNFSNTRELMQYLSEHYESVGRGVTNISGKYLRECLKDESKLAELEKTLEDADYLLKHAEENVEGFQSMKISIDEDGKMETETRSGKVSFNEGKRARQLAAAKTPENVRTVINFLSKDLADCEAGVQNGMCDENEVAKVKAMMQKAQQKMSEVTAAGSEQEQEEGIDTFSINMLM